MPRNIKLGDKGFERALRKYQDRFEEHVKKVVSETAAIIYSQAVADAPVAEVDGGNLRNSITMFSPTESKGLQVVVTVGADYAIYVEMGTGIYAKEGNGRNDPWVYYSEKLERWVFTRGMHPQPFFLPAVEKGRRYFHSHMR